MNLDKHTGKTKAAARRILWKLIILLFAVAIGGFITQLLSSFLVAASGVILVLWLALLAFTLYFFRDPTPHIPDEKGVIVAPAHGTVDYIGEGIEPQYLKGTCKRISIFLSVFDVHVQNAPIAGHIEYMEHKSGEFVNALKLSSATTNENLLIGLRDKDSSRKISVRLIAGLIARRIVPWVRTDEQVQQGERIGLIQFGSRVEIYLPLDSVVTIQLGGKVRGGETVLAKW
ncbi:MAG: phosphatidylserine decarboxylase [Verrucomicrobia bacterium]|jgi:phosphatidylserine decarboxylase|nr:phosphatidylserine decarboxylase [Verrucomicrobiota bacterium]